MSQRPARNPGAPKVRLGDIIRITRAGYWHVPGGTLRIPAGAVGEVFPWHTSDWGKGCAIKFEGFEHPTYRYFPQALLCPGVDGWPETFELLRRQGERKAA